MASRMKTKIIRKNYQRTVVQIQEMVSREETIVEVVCDRKFEGHRDPPPDGGIDLGRLTRPPMVTALPRPGGAMDPEDESDV